MLYDVKILLGQVNHGYKNEILIVENSRPLKEKKQKRQAWTTLDYNTRFKMEIYWGAFGKGLAGNYEDISWQRT